MICFTAIVFVLLLMMVFMIYSFQNLSCGVFSKLLGYVTWEQGWTVFMWNFLLVVVIINSNIWFLSFFSFWYSHYPHLTMLTVTLFLKFLSPICSLFVFLLGSFNWRLFKSKFLFSAMPSVLTIIFTSVIGVLLLPPPSTLPSPAPPPLSLILLPYSFQLQSSIFVGKLSMSSYVLSTWS